MIHLEKGQKLFDTDGMVVYDQTGFYNDGDSIICAMAFAPEEPVCRYEAQYIAYGNIVYNISDPAQLLEEVKKLDPASLFGKNKEEIAIDKAVEEIQTATSENLGTTEDITTGEVAGATTDTDTATTTEAVDNSSPSEVIIPETVPTATATTTATSTATSTPESTPVSVVSPDTSSSTPATIIESIVNPTATSTTSSTPATITATTTEPVTEQVIPTIENVISDLNKISDIVEDITASSSTNITP